MRVTTTGQIPQVQAPRTGQIPTPVREMKAPRPQRELDAGGSQNEPGQSLAARSLAVRRAAAARVVA